MIRPCVGEVILVGSKWIDAAKTMGVSIFGGVTVTAVGKRTVLFDDGTLEYAMLFADFKKTFRRWERASHAK